MEYLKRIVDNILQEKLGAMGAILIEGPKACGKTTTAEQQAKCIIYLDDPEHHKYYMDMSQTNIKYLLRGDTPLLLDEWQLVPQLWDAIRFEVDHRDEDGQFILTGSAVPADVTKITHSGAGRFGWVTMRTMSYGNPETLMVPLAYLIYLQDRQACGLKVTIRWRKLHSLFVVAVGPKP